jgi:excisionase family DNA binding protein
MPIAISLQQTADLLGLHRSTVRGILRRGDLPHRRLGRRVLIPRKAVEEYAYGPTPPIERIGI